MDIHSIRQMLRTKSIYDIPLRVTYYARVSSESDEQLNSLGNQVSYYEDFIKRNAAWTFVPGYIDEGLSGISTKKRENFNRMVEDAAEDKFDLIITKEISRFARNTLDSIQYTRQLLSAGVGVFFQNDNINTFDEDSELRLSIMSSIAQDELRKLSSRVKFGHQQAIKDNVVLGNSRIFGYVKDGGRLVIDEEQAVMVRELFELYATDEYSMKHIETIFWEKGYRNLNGKKIAHSTMANMIANPKYKGYYVGNKVKVVDMFTKKQKFLPPEEWVMFKDETGEIVPAIVSEELWDAANAVLHRRSEDVKNRQGICNHANLLTGKLFCTHCGTPYYRRESKDKKGNKNSKWICSGKINNGKDSCSSFPIYEEEIKPLLFEVFRDTREASAAAIEEYEKMYRSLTSSGELTKMIAKQENIIEMALKKKSKLLQLAAGDNITDADFKEMTAQCNAEIKSAEQELSELRHQEEASAEFHTHMEKIRTTLKAAERDVANGTITKEFVDTFIDKIFVTPEADGSMKLDIRIFTGESTEKYLQKLKGRAGHMTTVCERNEENADVSTGSDDSDRTGHTFKKMEPISDGKSVMRIHFCAKHMTAMVKTGIPLALQSILFPIANSIVQASVNGMGTDSIAAWGICDKMNLLIWLIADAMSPALTTYTAQNLGAKQPGRVKKGVLLGTGMSVGAVALVSLVLYLGAGIVGGWFVPGSDRASVIPLVIRYTHMMAPFFVFYAAAEAFTGACCGMGDTLIPMLTTLVTVCLLRVVCIFFVLPAYRTMECIVFIYIASWIAAGLSFTAMYAWKQHRMLKQKE